MNITCPCCGGRFSIEAALTDEAARRAVAAALAMPAPLGESVLRYLALFRPAKRALSWSRATRLLEELNAAIRAGTIRRHGRDWAAPQALWMEALRRVTEQPPAQLPLKDHAYLFEIVCRLSSSGEARQEQRRQDEAAYRYRHDGSGLVQASAILSPKNDKPRADKEVAKTGVEKLKGALK